LNLFRPLSVSSILYTIPPSSNSLSAKDVGRVMEGEEVRVTRYLGESERIDLQARRPSTRIRFFEERTFCLWRDFIKV
jgi:hypothetical protein